MPASRPHFSHPPGSALRLLAVLADNPGHDAAGLSKAAGFHGFERTARFLKQLQHDGLIAKTPVADVPGAPVRCSLTRRGHNFLRRASAAAPQLPAHTPPIPSPARDRLTLSARAASKRQPTTAGSRTPKYTHRTLAVLAAIAHLSDHGPEPSNMMVARAAGIADGGQVSKLLTRLEHLELVTRPHRPTAASPNQWSLTRRGRELLNRLSLQPRFTSSQDS